jgi:hypothetical protein
MGMFFTQLREWSRDDMVRGARITTAKFASPRCMFVCKRRNRRNIGELMLLVWLLEWKVLCELLQPRRNFTSTLTANE